MAPDGAFTITGDWLNKKTGKVVKVMNSIIDDDKMIIMTNMGQIDMEEFSRDYIQMSSEMYDEHGNKLSKEKEKEFEKHNKEILEKQQEIEFNQDFPEELLKQVQMEEKKSEITVETNVNVPKKEVKESKKTVKKLPKEELIRPIFEKIELNPQIHFSIDCETFPTAQFNMLQEFFDVTEKDIANYIIHYIIADEDFIGAVENFVKSKLTQ